MVHDSRALVKRLIGLILEQITPFKANFDVSDVKRDGTVIVKFRSDKYTSAHSFVATFVYLLKDRSLKYELIDRDCKVKLPIDQDW